MLSIKKLALCAISAILIATAAMQAAAQAPQFTIQPLPGVANAINDSNVITLVKPFDQTRVIGGLYNLDTLAWTPLTIAMPHVNLTDLSDSGWVAGTIRPAGGMTTIVAWNPSLVRATIRQTPNSLLSGPFVNSSGRVAWGEAGPGGGTLGRTGYAWAPGAGLTTNPALNSLAYGMEGVSPDGWIFGYTISPSRATYASAAGASFQIPMPPGATRTEGLDANARGQFLVHSVHPGGSTGIRSYVWTRTTGTYAQLASPSSGRQMHIASRFNDIGDAVGAGITSPTSVAEPMLWMVDEGYTFRELLGGAYPPGWTGFLMPLGINDNGLIIGQGKYFGVTTYFVMRPIGPWHP